MIGRRNLRWLVAGAFTASMALALPASGQFQPRRQQQEQQGAPPATVAPPRPPATPDRPPTLMMIFMAVLLGAGVVGTSLIPSKRGHQD